MQGINQTLASVYVTAMILSGLSQAAGSFVLVSGINPEAVQNALRSTISGLSASRIHPAYFPPQPIDQCWER